MNTCAQYRADIQLVHPCFEWNTFVLKHDCVMNDDLRLPFSNRYIQFWVKYYPIVLTSQQFLLCGIPLEVDGGNQTPKLCILPSKQYILPMQRFKKNKNNTEHWITRKKGLWKRKKIWFRKQRVLITYTLTTSLFSFPLKSTISRSFWVTLMVIHLGLCWNQVHTNVREPDSQPHHCQQTTASLASCKDRCWVQWLLIYEDNRLFYLRFRCEEACSSGKVTTMQTLHNE